MLVVREELTRGFREFASFVKKYTGCADSQPAVATGRSSWLESQGRGPAWARFCKCTVRRPRLEPSPKQPVSRKSSVVCDRLGHHHCGWSGLSEPCSAKTGVSLVYSP